MARVRGFLLAMVVIVAGCAEVTPRGAIGDGGASDAAALDDGGALDASPRDGGSIDASGADAAPPARGPLHYPSDRDHSPIDDSIAAELRAIAARSAMQDRVFAKVGDSITVSTSFMHCFTGSRVDLDGRDPLRGAIDHFAGGDAAGTSPFTRTSAAAGVGWSASRATMGSPSPLEMELAAISPRFAVVMYGTNDVGFVDYDAYARAMIAIVDALIARGVVPLLSSIPPRDDSADADARVPAFGGIVRALAQSRALPFMDYHRALAAIPGHGLASDGVHPQAFGGGACVLTSAGLAFAANVRNLLVLESLDRARRVVVAGLAAPDASAPRLAGGGSRADPYVLASLPASARVDTRVEGAAEIASWPSCSMADESGAEVRFRFSLDRARRVTAVLASGAGADLDVHLVRAGGGGDACVARGNRDVSATLEAGEWDVVVDTFGGASMAGEGLLYVAAE